MTEGVNLPAEQQRTKNREELPTGCQYDLSRFVQIIAACDCY